MKKNIFMFLMAVMVLFSACAAGIREERAAQESGANNKVSNTGSVMSNVSSLVGHDWKLIEVYIGGLNTQFTRSSLPNELRDCFTLKFDGQMASGTGAPNLYSAPYTVGDDQTIRIMMMRSTLMASLFEPENLKEHDFFTYVQNSTSWRIAGGQMELYSKTADDREVRMVFGL